LEIVEEKKMLGWNEQTSIVVVFDLGLTILGVGGINQSQQLFLKPHFFFRGGVEGHNPFQIKNSKYNISLYFFLYCLKILKKKWLRLPPQPRTWYEPEKRFGLRIRNRLSMVATSFIYTVLPKTLHNVVSRVLSMKKMLLSTHVSSTNFYVVDDNL
jgi:hypothetical protein